MDDCMTVRTKKGAMMPYQPADKVILDNLDALKAYFDPVRLQIVQEMSYQPRTVHDIAEALDVPFTRLYYHIKMLEKHNIIRVVETRAMSGAVEEKYYQVTARQFIVDRSLLTTGDADDSAGLNTLLTTILEETHDDIKNSVRGGKIQLQEISPHPESLLVRRGIFRLSREQAARFHEDLLALMNRYLDIEASRDDPYYALAIALYPTMLPYMPGQDEGAEG
jgi:DNA-binding transcriptional ArsR family regulator